MTVSLMELKETVKIALGTPETVNFKALHKLLAGILSHLAAVEKYCDLQLPKVKKKRSSIDRRRSDASEMGQGADTDRSESNLADEDPALKPKKRKPRMQQEDSADQKEEVADRKEVGRRRSFKETPRLREGPVKKSGHKKLSPPEIASSNSSGTPSDKADKRSRSRKSTIRKPSMTRGKGLESKVSSASPSKAGEEEAGTSAKLQAQTSKEKEDGGEAAKEKEEEEEEEDAEEAGKKSSEEEAKEPKDKDGSDSTEEGGEQAEEGVGQEAAEEEGLDAEREGSEVMEDVLESSVNTTTTTASETETNVQLECPKPSTSAKDDNQPTQRDVDDLLKRVLILEQDVDKVKRENNVLKGTVGSGGTEKEIANLEKKEKILHKHIEMVEKETDDRVASIWKELKEMRAQLQYLPNPKDLYKSFYPSWKMLEDALCSFPSLKENIEEAKRGVEKGQGQGAGKQLSKFLGAPGPSERMLDSLTILGRLVEQTRAGCYDQLQLTAEVAEAKTSVSSKKAGSGLKYPVEGRAFQKTVTPQDDQEEEPVPAVKSESSHKEVVEKTSLTKVESQSKVGADSGYMNFKMTKLVEEILGIRKELDDMQLWKDRLVDCQNDLKDLAEMLINLKREMDSNEERDHDILASLQMDMNELQLELCGMESKKAIQARREEMDTIKTSVQDSRYTTLGDVVIDREARIRTQQLQLQLNALHHMVAEIECRLPDLTCSSAPVGLPADMQHPWGTGRAGVGTNMRAGVGTTATAVVAPSSHKSGGISSPSPSPRPTSDARPTPLGGGGSEEMAKVASDQKPSSLTPSAEGTEHLNTQFAIIRLNQGQSALAAQVEACQNQQNSEIRRIQDLMTRMHREYMIRCANMQEQLTSLLGEKMEESDGSGSEMRSPREVHEAKLGKGTTEATGQLMTVDEVSEPSLSEHRLPGSGRKDSGGRRASSGARCRLNMELLMGLRKEVMGYINGLKRRVEELESTCLMAAPDADPALLKKPVLHRFQCLSCDKWIDITQPRIEERMPASSVPELPRLPMLTSPPRIRNASKSQYVLQLPLSADE